MTEILISSYFTNYEPNIMSKKAYKMVFFHELAKLGYYFRFMIFLY